MQVLEDGAAPDGDDAALPPADAAPASSEEAGGGVVVQGAAQRSEQLASKMFDSGGFRETATIRDLMPRGGAGLKNKVPERLRFGAECEAGDAGHCHGRDEGVLARGVRQLSRAGKSDRRARAPNERKQCFNDCYCIRATRN